MEESDVSIQPPGRTMPRRASMRIFASQPTPSAALLHAEPLVDRPPEEVSCEILVGSRDSREQQTSSASSTLVVDLSNKSLHSAPATTIFGSKLEPNQLNHPASKPLSAQAWCDCARDFSLSHTHTLSLSLSLSLSSFLSLSLSLSLSFFVSLYLSMTLSIYLLLTNNLQLAQYLNMCFHLFFLFL
jgi:hypothetical protein